MTPKLIESVEISHAPKSLLQSVMKQAEAEVGPSSSLVEIEVDVGVEVGVEVGIGGAGVGVGSLRWVVEDEVKGKHMSK